MPEVDAWLGLQRGLRAGFPCALLVVADSRGSSPGRRGAVMAVSAGGPLAGTIGGGLAEARLVERAVDGLSRGALASELVVLEHRWGSPAASGLVCGGSQTVIIVPMPPGCAPEVDRVVEVLTEGRTIAWQASTAGWRLVAHPEQASLPGLGPDLAARGPTVGLMGDRDDWTFLHSSGPTHVVHLVGGGHVASTLIPMLVSLDFRVVVIEERPTIDATGSAAHEWIRVPYEDLAQVVAPGRSSFAAIMTQRHERDGVALEVLRQVPLGYLGLLGSVSKVRRLVGQRRMPRTFHAPIGVPIGSTSAPEIAVSIAAEMIAVRAGQR